MKRIEIQPGEEGERLDRYLYKRLPYASKGIIQKSLRKKNITLNDKKALPQTNLCVGDILRIYFSDETYDKFSKKPKQDLELPKAYIPLFNPPLYEDFQLLAIDKPVGLLSQPDGSSQLDLATLAKAYLPWHPAFTPGVSNRLDRNTSGVVLIPKNAAFKRRVDSALRKQKSIKEYRAILRGALRESRTLRHYLLKDEQTNTVSVYHQAVEGALYAELQVVPLSVGKEVTYVSIFLKTGRSHQIRAQLSAIGHGILGDRKYGDAAGNWAPSLKHQLLHSYRYALDDLGIDIVAPLPKHFLDLLAAFHLKGASWDIGKPED
ncbi:MAG: RluA family pseudouridine synthase [Eubacteriaceae bacterium]|jgi:23S rRNA pseudouridine955/2504/2580 synthase|nr:RluA family pseudouridine synthase [Eubacteriaceae bacterium]